MGQKVSHENIEELAKEIIKYRTIGLTREYEDDPLKTQRDVHAKTLGLLKGEFEVVKNLPGNFRHGFLSIEGPIPCWLRFSSTNPVAQSDLLKDVRGCAIKLLNADSTEQINQDFVLVSIPVLPLGTATIFRDFIVFFATSSVFMAFFKFFLRGNLYKLIQFFFYRTTCDSILGCTFHSTTPFALGPVQAVKYCLRLTNYPGPSLSRRTGYDYLSRELQGTVNNQDLIYELCIQLQKDEKLMPIDDAAVLWSEKLSPFIKVATLRIPAGQQVASPDRLELAERMQFDPCVTFPENEGLGGLNKVRHLVYEALQKLRHELSHRQVAVC